MSLIMIGVDISWDLKSALIDEYTNEKTPDDGEFYWKLREYQGIFGQENPYFERRWWARLAAVSTSANKKDRFEQLFRHRKFAPAFDSFRYLRALYCGLRISVINKMISLKCDEVRFSHLFFYCRSDQPLGNSFFPQTRKGLLVLCL